MASPAALDGVRSFTDMIPIVEQVEVRLSFWGTRYVHLPLLNTTLPIDAIAARMIELVQQNPQFDENTRATGRRIAPLIDRIYQISDQQVAQSNCFTRLLVYLRNLPNIYEGAGIRISSWTLYQWRDCEAVYDVGYRQIFEYYTREEYQRNFHCYPESILGNRLFPNCDHHRPPRWLAPQAFAQG